MTIKDFSMITESPGARVTRDQVLRVYQRYHFAAQFCHNKDVLEVACGGGSGLGLLANVARSVVAIDVEEKNLAHAQSTYGGDTRVRIERGDAEALAIPTQSVDVVILYEAIYYLPHVERFFAECRRVLRPGGMLIIGSANCEWRDFNPSHYSVRYYSSRELYAAMERYGFVTTLYKGFPIADAQGPVEHVVSLLKRTAVRCHLIPKSMKYKKILKRFFMGRLELLPRRLIDGVVEYIAPEPVNPATDNWQFKVIYAVGRCEQGHGSH